MSDIKKIKGGIKQCWLLGTEDEYETQCWDCPYFDPERSVDECRRELRKEAVEVLDKVDSLEKALKEKQTHLENLQKVNKELEERIATMSESDNDWHFFNFRPMTDEEKEYYELADYEGEDAQMLENCPLDGEEVILWTPWGMSIDTYHWDIDGAYFDEHEEIEKGWAWKYPPKQPEPPKAGEAEC